MSKAWIFDFDGTLVHSEAVITQCFESITKKLAPHRLEVAKQVLIGPPLRQTVAEILGDPEHPLIDEFVSAFIQMHDDDVKESISPARVGLSLKNIKHDEITRGDILSNDTSIKTVTEITIDFKQNQFFKATLAENQMCLVSVGLQIKAAKFASISPMKLTFEKPVIVMPGDVCVLLKPESNTIRIIGSGAPQ